MTVAGHPIIYGPDAGAAVALGGIGVCFKVPGAATGGAFSIVEHPVRPGTLVPPHVHADEDELSNVLEGTFGVRVGDAVLEAGPEATSSSPAASSTHSGTPGQIPPASSRSSPRRGSSATSPRWPTCSSATARTSTGSATWPRAAT